MGIGIDKLLIKVACGAALAAILLPGVATAEDAGNPYCVAPPFISGGIKPNLLMLIDNSSSMYDMGYIAGSNGTVPSYSCGSNTVTSAYCFDNTYDDSRDYEGYFSTYNPITNSSNYPFYQYSGGKFEEVAGLPATAADNVNIFKTGYLYVGLTGSASATPSTRTVSTFIASGKFLNWLSASKFDIEKKILTGGKFDTATSTLKGESRGCVGRRFVKVLPAVPELSFSVRGPSSVEPNFNPSTQGGQSTIEVFEGEYNSNACQCAVYYWSNGSYGQASTSTKDCLGTTPADNALATLNHSQQTCFVLKKKFADPTTSYDSDGWPTTGLNFTDIKTACTNVYLDNKNPILPADLTDESSGNYICTSAALHGIPAGRYVGPASDTTGFVGRCWNNASDKFGSGAASDSCLKREILHYCMGTNFAEVTDPSGIIPTSGNIPAVIMDAGVRAIGAPVGVFDVKVDVSSAPTGLVQQFSEDIRFGAMKFNDFGSVTECGSSSLPCPASGVTNKDAGTMMPNSYVGSAIGNHDSGIIKDIDDVMATTWTPFAEGYYNAIAYFTKDAVATTPSLSATKFTPRTTAPASIAAPVNATDFEATRNPIQFRCQQNNIMIITDGSSTADQNATVTTKVQEGGASGVFRDPGTTAEAATCGSYSGSPFLHDLSYFAKHRNIFNPTQVCDPVGTDLCETAQTIRTHVVFNAPPGTNTTDVCDPYNQMRLTALNGGTTVNSAADPGDLRAALKTALESVAAGASSGTAASILSNSEGSGANILQAVFFPKKVFESQTSVDWIGEMQNLWYYVDPQISRSTIREDTPPGDLLRLNLQHDKVVRFRFNAADNTTYGYLSQDTNGDGVGDTAETEVDADDVNSLWRAGKILHARNVLSDPRNLYTPLISGGTELPGSNGLMRFSYGEGSPARPDHSELLTPYLQASSAADAGDIMKFVQGFDIPTMRNRTVKKWGIPAGIVGSATYLDDSRLRGIGVWKLGDIVSSTPRIQSVSKLNNYNLPGPSGYSDSSYSSYINSDDYKGRGMVYVGANDGMMHAFKLGVLRVNASGFEKATIDPDPDLGKEMWSYIPKSVLPYLNYYPASNYHHLYYVDGSSLLFDASIGTRSTGSGTCTTANYWECTKLSSVVDSSNNLNGNNTWRSILIGGMGLGGASTKTCDSGDDCVQTPITDPANGSLGLGYSSYFALDVTTPTAPKLLWEFNHADLGFATSGPAIIRVGPPDKNGRWFAVFGSGPTGPVDTENNQFMGRSNQTLKFFIVDLVTGVRVHTIDTGIEDAFAGSMMGAAIDADRWNQYGTGNYQDDAIYVGYTRKVSGTPDTWSNGGVIRIMTKESSVPSTWAWSSVVSDTGPVTSAISRLQDRKNKNLWLYFGTGRYYYRYGATVDDFGSRRAIYGIKEPCYNHTGRPGNVLNSACTATVTGGVTNQSTSITGVGGGWKIDLDQSSTANGAERVVTDAVALTNGSVFFTSFAPTADACGFGGNSYLWALDYDTGGRPDDAALVGKALIQLSTGEFKEVDLAEAFGSGAARLNRRTSVPMTGKPPADAFPIVTKSGNKPVKRIMHIQER